ncbi:hypothetical protein P7C71_g4190, partial [Lecanoromycetidae sp. Uapishka_2]
MALTMASLRGTPSPEDPDAQHTVTDFLDYTEYLPSDLVRSLTLIGKLDESYLTAADTVHDLTKEYGALPTTSPTKKAKPQALRSEISHNLDHAISCRESSYGEATRLYEMVDRHYHRLTSIITKLHALPKPPSRDPTPVPRSPQAVRKTPPPRITLRLDGARSAGRGGSAQPLRRHRKKIFTVPGEVLPPPNPDSPAVFTDSDWESAILSPPPIATSRVGGSRKPVRIRPPKPPKIPKLKVPKAPRPPRPPGAMGTNVHSSVAGISTSNALSLLTPPPPDAKPGTKHQPWLRLTEWEMAKLRKRMKKNAIWTPSETMIRRELSIAGRGPDNYKKSLQKARDTGEDFIDDDNIAATADPSRPLAPGEISATHLGLQGMTLENRGMKLNEAKKQKREILARERAAELENEAQKLGSLGSTFKELFSKPPALAPAIPNPALAMLKVKDTPKLKTSHNEKPTEITKTPAKKRKHEEIPKPDVPPEPLESTASPVKHSIKKRKTTHIKPPPLTVTTKTVTTTVPLAAPAPSPSRPSRRSTPATPATPVMAAPEKPKAVTTPKDRATATSSRPRRISLTLKAPAEPPLEPILASPRTATRPSTRRSSVGQSPTTSTRDQPSRKTRSPAPPQTSASVVTAAGRRSKRPAPGPIVEAEDGGAAVSIGKRQHAPKKRGAMAAANEKRTAEDMKIEDKENATKATEAFAGDDIDPDEPRYCLCGDVSYGDMVACENDKCEREWFHFACVRLTESPPRRQKWYCPECKVTMSKK